MEEKFYLHWMNLMPELGPKRLWALKRHFGSFDEAATASAADVIMAGLPKGIANNVAARCAGPDLDKKILGEMAKLAKLGINIITFEDEAFPPLLREIAEPPLLLYCRGGISKISSKVCVAIVGSRRPTAYGLAVTEKLVGDLVAAGVVIVSGLAYGIDMAAHRAVLKNGGVTVAVVPTGVDEFSIYPQGNSRAANLIAESGCAISECPPGSSALPYSFLARNRIISGLCSGTVIVECAERSGALITARCALDQNRAVYAVPGSIFNPMSRGPHSLLRQGAIPINSAGDILKDLGLADAVTEEKIQNLTMEEKILLSYMNTNPINIDTIISAAKLPPAQAIALLSSLELKGIIISGSGKYSKIK